MAADLAPTPRSDFEVQACGDAHLSNFGAYASPERRLVFDLNDFDETLPGPWEWDAKRLAASFSLAAREAGCGGKQRREIVRAAATEYRETMRRLAAVGNLESWYRQLDAEEIAARWGDAVGGRQRRRIERGVARARRKDSARAFERLTVGEGASLGIRSEPPELVPIDELGEEVGVADPKAIVLEALGRYRESVDDERRAVLDGYRFVDAAFKVVGVGSVGTRAWVVLLTGRDEGDPLFLQIKEAQRSVLEPYTAPSRYEHQGERVVQGQRLMQASSDILLGWVRAQGIDGDYRDFYVRQLWDWKGSAKVEAMDARGLTAYAQICGTTLAHAHARGGDRIAIAAYLGRGDSFDDAMADFAEAYAKQAIRDHAALKQAVEEGRVEAEAG
jgi:uncharacterized protein (DUF2252 family)